MAGAMTARKPVAFLFLGETLLIPHLWPIAEAMAQDAPDVPIDLWISTSVHEALLGGWSLPYPNMRVRRAPGFRHVPLPQDGRNPVLPGKMPMLARLAPRLVGAAGVVCAEQTSLWLPTILPLGLPPFVKTSHGVGSMSARDDRRRRAATLTLVPSELERGTYLQRGFDPARIVATGYMKASFTHRTPARALFPEPRETIVYAPHWQRRRSSWWAWGREIVAMLAAQDRWNVILAPHQRLLETEPEVRAILQQAAHRPHVHADWSSFAMVDGSYMAAADLYLGDTSSQVIEFLATPRPCVFLNNEAIDWRATDDHDFWHCGEVIDTLDRLADALGEAPGRHAAFADAQIRIAGAALGATDAGAPHRAVAEIMPVLGF